MSWSRRAVLFGALALTAGCGLRPVGPAATALQGAIRIADPTDKNSFDLTRQIEKRFGPPQAPRYRLDVNVQTKTEGVAVSAADETTREQVLGEASFVLTEIATNRVVSAGTTRSFTGYSTTGSTVATRTAEIDASKRLMVILADRITTQILADVAA